MSLSCLLPSLQTFLPLNKTHPAMIMVPDRWTFVCLVIFLLHLCILPLTSHFVTRHQPEEVYHFRSDPRSVGAVVLMTVDEDSYNRMYNLIFVVRASGQKLMPRRRFSSHLISDTGSSTGNYPSMGTPHPIAWYQDAGAAVDNPSAAGRSFFTSLGHTNETWQVGLASLSPHASPTAHEIDAPSCRYVGYRIPLSSRMLWRV